MICKFIDVNCLDNPSLTSCNCDEECWVYWRAQNHKNWEEGQKLLNQVRVLQDQRHRRNALIKKLRAEIENWKNGVLHLDKDNQVIKENIYNSIIR